ncbi:MarR family transcriptional regulator [Streptomyces sp. x-80]|uniref:MarR family transcriptional regulator n=1 Tax=Streptomyces sp. x-80 TaxID=2789282 RepID=UPI00397FBC58
MRLVLPVFRIGAGRAGRRPAPGVVVREPDPEDGRASVIHMSTAGVAQLDAWARAQERRFTSAPGALGPQDREAVRAALPALFTLAEHLHDPADS